VQGAPAPIAARAQKPEAAGRSTQGRRIRTRAVKSIDRTVSLNRALWILAEEMRRLKA